MPTYFFDASAIVKRYVREAGSEWVGDLIGREHPRIFISTLSGAEVVAAIARKGRAGEVSPRERDKALRVFRQDFATSYALISPESTVIYRAMDLLLNHPLRAYDAVQLASALVLPPLPGGLRLTFVSADDLLLKTTTRLGLPTENPNLHG